MEPAPHFEHHCLKLQLYVKTGSNWHQCLLVLLHLMSLISICLTFHFHCDSAVGSTSVFFLFFYSNIVVMFWMVSLGTRCTGTPSEVWFCLDRMMKWCSSAWPASRRRIVSFAWRLRDWVTGCVTWSPHLRQR